LLSPAQTTGKEQNQKDEQDDSKPTPTDQRAAEVKSAAAEQEHQDD